MAKKSSSAPAILEFLGALIFLYVVFSYISYGGTASWLAGAGAVWVPIIVGVGAVASVALFLASIAGLAGMGGEESMHAASKFSVWGGLTAMVIGSGTGMFWWALVGFIIAYVGSAWAKME